MSLREYIARLFGSDEGEKPSRSRLIRPAKRAPVVRYTDLLLSELIDSKQQSLTLKQSGSPPAVSKTGQTQDVDVPPFVDIRNRLKFLAGLNPVTYLEPVDGRFEWTRRSETVVVQVHFDDRASDPFCTVRLSRETS